MDGRKFRQPDFFEMQIELHELRMKYPELWNIYDKPPIPFTGMIPPNRLKEGVHVSR